MKMLADFYMAILLQWSGTPMEKFAQWETTYNDVSPPPQEVFETDLDVANYLAEFCDHTW